MRRAGHHARVVLVATLLMASVASCVVDTPGIENAEPAATSTATEQPTTAPPQFEPTAPPQPTPTLEPTAVATATPVPAPTATPTPVGPPPLPTSAPEDEFVPAPTDPGLVVVPVRGARFMLATTRPILQLGGHTLIYVDDQLNAEVDIFTPVAAADGTPIATFPDLIAVFQSDPVFSGLSELSPVSIAGLQTRVFEGTAQSPDRAFITELAAADNDQLGWFPPARMRLWVINHPDGPVVVSAESLENPGRYSEAVRLATEILSTIDFG